MTVAIRKNHLWVQTLVDMLHKKRNRNRKFRNQGYRGVSDIADTVDAAIRWNA